MRKTREQKTDIHLAVDLKGLAAMLSCGESTARRIGEDAEARVTIGRRVLYCVSKVEKYLEDIAI